MHAWEPARRGVPPHFGPLRAPPGSSRRPDCRPPSLSRLSCFFFVPFQASAESSESGESALYESRLAPPLCQSLSSRPQWRLAAARRRAAGAAGAWRAPAALSVSAAAKDPARKGGERLSPKCETYLENFRPSPALLAPQHKTVLPERGQTRGGGAWKQGGGWQL